jgi:hypothetical protein
MEVYGHLHDPPAVSLGKEPTAPIGEKVRQIQEPFWTWWWKEISAPA